MKSSRRCLASAFWVLSFVCVAASLSFGQGSKSTSEYEPIQDRDRDNPQARDQWFMRGRTAPNGESAALLRYQAYQQKLQLRRQQFAARAIVAVPHMSSSGWNPLGPAPLASDATVGGWQDYHQVSGRATAVAIDPADTTGNTVYIGGAHGGVWKSINAGPASASAASVAWSPVLDYESTLAVGAIAIQPGNTDPTKSVILVGTGEPNSSADSYYGLGILRSADGGQTWTLIQSANGGARPFAGMGFSKIAFNSTSGKTNVVVAAAAAAETGIAFGLETTSANRGLYYSQDSGVTWNYATVQDSGVTVDPGSATSVVYNQTAGMFFAALRYHGFYSSTDGITWSRLTSQPASLTMGLCPSALPPPPAMSACPIYRAEMAVVPGRNEMYTWVVALDTTATEVDRGIWSRNATSGAWAQIADSGITSCESGTTDGCGVQQGSYNLELAAVPDGATATDLYPGAINIYKCTIANPTAASPSCTFMNLTHVYGCSPLSSLAHVHPDQHALDFMLAGTPAKAVMYFANDGGIYRALDGYTGLTTGNCSGSGTNAFDSLNGTIGSMTQFVWFSVHPTDANTLLGGTQDNGSPATTTATTSTSWGNVQGGDGGYNAISPANGTDWYAAGPDIPPNTPLSINHCTAGLSCNNNTFTPVVVPSQLGTDEGAFYFPYMLDPQAPTRLIIGTCRVWRGGPSTSASGTYTALSNNFETGGTTACAGTETNLVRSLAAGGPTDANGSKVIYAGTDLGTVGTSPAGGRVFVTKNASTTLMTDVTGSINPTEYPVSGIAVDTSDATGQTAFVTIMGFHVSHVFKTTNAGTTWTDFTSNLPDSPADAAVIDPQAHVVYVGTDVGVFSSSTASASWTEVGPLAAAGNTGYLPNVPVTALAIFNSGGKKLLRASTYGRGIWEYNLSATPDYQIAISNPTLTIFPTQTATFNGTLTAVNSYTSPVQLSCTGTLVPATCTPNPNPVIPTAAPAAAFTVGASGAVGDYPFNVHGVGTDASTTTHDAAVTLHIVDFSLGAPSPASVSVQQGNTSSGVAFVVTGAGSFNGTVTLACPASGMPTGVTCAFSPSASVSALPATVTLTFKTTASTPTGTTAITISATTPGAPAAKTQSVSLTVTTISPDYALTISNSPLSATVNTSGTFTGTLTALNGYASAVNLTCGTGAPPTCTVSPNPVTPTVAGAPFTVTVQSNLAQAYNFSISGTGTDAAHIAHVTPVVFNSLFTFTVADTSTTQTVKAGQPASYSLTVTPVGSNTFPNAVSFTCSNWSPSQPAGAACSAVTPVNAGANGVQTVTLNIMTAGLGKTQIRPLAKDVAPFFVWVSAVGMMIGGFGRKSWARKKAMAALGIVLLLGSTIVLPACGGSGSGGGGGGGASVTVSPKTASPFPTQTQPFTAVVGGSTNQAVTWQVSGVTGGNSTVGTIDTTGVYTAPATVPSPNPVAVSALSQADVTKSDSAMVTIKTPTPSGTYTVTVTATVGTVSQTATAVLTVQ